MTPPGRRTPTAGESDAQKILAALADEQDGYCLSFNGIANRTGLERKRIRVVVRRLARKGLTLYVRGLWTEDGDMAGSGYGITALGRAALRSCAQEPADA